MRSIFAPLIKNWQKKWQIFLKLLKEYKILPNLLRNFHNQYSFKTKYPFQYSNRVVSHVFHFEVRELIRAFSSYGWLLY